MKDEPTTPPPHQPSPAKKARNSPSTPKSSPFKEYANGIPGSAAKTKRGMYMEMLFEAGIKAVNKQEVQGRVSRLAHTPVRIAQSPDSNLQTGLSPAQQQEMIRKDKGALRKAVTVFVASL